MQFALFDVVRLLEAIPEKDLHAGDEGAIVEVYTKPAEGYEVEFDDFVLVSLTPQQIALATKSQTATTA